MKQKKIIVLVISILCSLTTLHAQEVISTTGHNSTGNGGSVSYSIGQIFYITEGETTGTIVQGVQQPYNITVISEVKEAKAIELMICAYPNPVHHYLRLMVDNTPVNNLSYQLFNANGQSIARNHLTENETSIYMNNFSSAVYFLKIFESNKKVKTFKIIKK